MANHSRKVAYYAILLLALSPVVKSQTSASTSVRRFTNRFLPEVNNLNAGVSTVMSPLSVCIALSLLTMGADGDTLTEINNAISMDDQDETRDVYGGLMTTLTSAQSVILNVANKVYVYHDVTINPSFETDAVDVFQSEVESIDFVDNVNSATTINEWVESKTNNTIKDLISPDMLTALTRLVLVNAIYFKGDWERKFNAKNTKKQAFNLLNSKVKQVDMMSQNAQFAYGDLPSLNAKAVEMPFKGQEYTMVIVLPNKNNGLTSIEKGLKASTSWKKLLANLKSTYIKLSVPKFKIETAIDLKKILPNLGIELMFDENRSQLSQLLENFDNILYVSEAVQKAFIDVNEEGTTAAAATAIVVNTKSAPAPPKISFIADRPFLYLIRNKLGHILFIGCYKG